MPSDRDRVRLELDVNAAHPREVQSSARTPAPSRDGERCFRIALIGDFGGRDGRPASKERGAEGGGEGNLESRTAIRVDRDSLDDAIARLEPRLALSVGRGAAPVEIRFSSLEDFHPDRLVERLPLFRALRDAKTLAAASPHVDRQAGPTPAGLLDAMLEEQPLPPGGAALANAPTALETATDQSLAEVVRRAVEPYVVREAGAGTAAHVASVEAEITAALRDILHDPRFQALEALWRGVDLLVRRLDTDERLQLHLIDFSREELRAALPDDRARKQLRRLLETSAPASDERPWSLVIGCYSFGNDSGDVHLLGQLAAIARDIGAPVIVAADPVLAGTSSFATSADPDDWSEAVPPGWDALRASADAAFLGMTLPRFLLRQPYGKRADPCELVRFEEMDEEIVPPHDHYLWGNGALAVALLVGAAAADGESSWRGGRIDGLPLHLVRTTGAVEAKPCAELLLSQRDAERLLERGLIPLMSERDSDAIVLPRLQSVASPLAPLARTRSEGAFRA